MNIVRMDHKSEKAFRRAVWVRRFVTGFLVLCWMFVIGSFSAQPGAESGSLSRGVAKKAVRVEEKLSGKTYTDKERDVKIESMQFPIRKLAHMTEYAVLAVLLALHLGCYAFGLKNLRLRLFLTWLIAAAYAAADEVHQLFVDGRSGSFVDVCIDSAGAFLGVLCFAILFRGYRRHVRRIKNIKKID